MKYYTVKEQEQITAEAFQEGYDAGYKDAIKHAGEEPRIKMYIRLRERDVEMDEIDRLLHLTDEEKQHAETLFQADEEEWSRQMEMWDEILEDQYREERERAAQDAGGCAQDFAVSDEEIEAMLD